MSQVASIDVAAPSPASRPSLLRRSLRLTWRITYLAVRAVAVTIVLFVAFTYVAAQFPRKMYIKDWITDYSVMRDYIADNYANLEWSIAEGRIDPYRLNWQTLAALRSSRSDLEARQALIHFVKAFNDPHLALLRSEARLRGQPHLSGKSARPASYTPARFACRMLGYEKPSWRASISSSFALERFPFFKKSRSSDNYPAGIVELDSGHFGVVRVPSFDVSEYPEACERVWPQVAGHMNGRCNNDCYADVWNRVEGQLVEDFAQQVRDLAARPVDALVIDVTDNPGGSGMLAAMLARVVTTESLPSGRTVLVKNYQALDSLRLDRARVLHALDAKGLSSAAHKWLDEGFDRSEHLLKEFRGKPCDRRSWFTKPARADCTRLTTGEYFADGFFAELPRDYQIPLALGDSLFRTRSRESDREGVWGGPVIVLVDRASYSSAELFAQTLHEHAGALLLGERTAGAGGGWLFNQGTFVLPNSHLRLVAPDTVDFLKDGRNARVGLEPDICLERRPGASPVTRATVLLQTLKRLF